MMYHVLFIDGSGTCSLESAWPGAGGGAVPATPPGTDGPHNPGLAVGGQQCGQQGGGPGLCCEARQVVCGEGQGLVSGAETRERVDPGGSGSSIRYCSYHDPGMCSLTLEKYI